MEKVQLEVRPTVLGIDVINLRRVVDGKTEATGFDSMEEAIAYASEFGLEIV